ncbi:MAG: hypothetical protein ACTSPY_16675 [Candidatus Helarchaeota archaeon]
MNFKSKRILIIGGGKVGIEALNFCRKNNLIPYFVDNNPECIVHGVVDQIITNLNDINDFQFDKSVLFVIDLKYLPKLINAINFDYLIPAIPIHVIGKLVIDYFLTKNIRIKPSKELIHLVYKKIDKILVYKYDETMGIIISSYMPPDQICKPNCIEYLVCPITKIRKEKPLYEYLKEITINYQSMIIISEQLKPSLGGISITSIKGLFKYLNSITGKFIIGTSCKCHGIINAFEFIK